mgnify:CR=1 FL=1
MELQKGRPENTDNRLDKENPCLWFFRQTWSSISAYWPWGCYDYGSLRRNWPRPWRQHHDLQKICSCAIVRRRIFIFFWCLVINRLRQKISLRRSIPPDYLLPNRNIWRNILISPLDPSVYWDWWMILRRKYSFLLMKMSWRSHTSAVIPVLIPRVSNSQLKIWCRKLFQHWSMSLSQWLCRFRNKENT